MGGGGGKTPMEKKKLRLRDVARPDARLRLRGEVQGWKKGGKEKLTPGGRPIVRKRDLEKKTARKEGGISSTFFHLDEATLARRGGKRRKKTLRKGGRREWSFHTRLEIDKKWPGGR